MKEPTDCLYLITTVKRKGKGESRENKEKTEMKEEEMETRSVDTTSGKVKVCSFCLDTAGPRQGH